MTSANWQKQSAAKAISEDKDKRLLVRGISGWGQGLNRHVKTKVLMKEDTQEITHLPTEDNQPTGSPKVTVIQPEYDAQPSTPVSAAEQQSALVQPLSMTGSDGP
jgi:hypothetical protein